MTHKAASSYFGRGQEARHCWVSMFPTFPGGHVVSQNPASSYSFMGQLVTHSCGPASPNSPGGQVVAQS